MSPIYFTLQEMANGGEFNKRDSVPVFSLLEGVGTTDNLHFGIGY